MSDGQHGAAQPGQRERDRPVRAQALPVPVVRVDPAVGRLQLRAHRQPASTRRNGLYHDLQSEATTPAFSWISPNNCSDAHDAVCHGNNLSGGFSDPNTPNAPVNYTGGLYAADLFLEHVDPRDRGIAGVQGRRPDRRHLRRGVPAVHLHRQQLRQLDDRRAERGDLGRVRLGRRDPVRAQRELRADRAEHAAGEGQPAATSCTRARATTRSSTGPSNCVAQTVPPQPAGTCLLGGGSIVPGARTDAGATAAARSVDDRRQRRSWRPTPAGR